MEKLREQSFFLIMFMWLINYATCPVWAQDQANDDYITVSGVVKDKQTRKQLEYVNISIPGTQIGTITNKDGEFSIKIRRALQARQVEVSHIGYLNGLIPVQGESLANCMVWLEPNFNSLNEIIVRAGEPRHLVEEAMRKIGENYLSTGSLLTGFYRETAQKGRHYISISEAIVHLFKTPYRDRNVERDRVQIHKGRKLLSQKPSDTLAVKDRKSVV